MSEPWERPDGYVDVATWIKEWRKRNPDKVWFGLSQCGLCYKAIEVLGGDPDKLREAEIAHRMTHPDLLAAQEREVPFGLLMDEARQAIHRNCNHRRHRCPCICGCEEIQSCDCWSDLCPVCQVRIGRGDDAHGYPADVGNV